jgi:TonB family protein
MTPPNPDVTAPPKESSYVRYLFCADPDFIDPDPLEPEHVKVGAKLDREPTAEQIAAAMPADAKAADVSALVTLDCTAEVDGTVDGCHEVVELPLGGHLGAVAVGLAPRYHAIPATRDGKPIAQPIQVAVLLGPKRPPLLPPAPARTSTVCALHAGLSPPAPRWPAQRLTPEDMARAYPHGALLARIGGYVEVHCKIEPDGHADHCLVTRENPADVGFGRAALALVRILRYEPAPAATPVDLPIQFVPPR